MTNEVPPAGTAASGDQPTTNPSHVEDDNHDDNDADDSLPHDEEASYCSTTSEESLAHSDADEDDDDDDDDEAGDTIASPSRTSSARRTVRTPSFSYDDLARRPRSNPRTRTPLRNPSPLLQGLRREQHVAAAAAAETTASLARNVPGMPSPQIRAAPQDAGTSDTNTNVASEAVSPPQAQQQPQPQPQQQRVTIRLNAGLPVGSLPSSSTASARAPTSSTIARRHAHQSTTQRSTKQGPSRRKIRRWTNDSMRSIAIDLARSNTRGSLAAADVYARGVSDGELRRQYEMPNAPRNYRSSFDVLTRLVDRWELEEEDKEDGDGENDGGNAGPWCRGRVGDVIGNNSRRKKKEVNARSKQKKKDRERKKQRAELLAARDKFLRGETAGAVLNPADRSSSSNEESRFSSGTAMFRHLDPRIRSIVIRAVSSTSTSLSSPMTVTTPTTYAAKLLNAMEDLLVHRRMASDESRELVDEVLARPLIMGGDADADVDATEDDNKSTKEDKKMTKKKDKNKKTKDRPKKPKNQNKVGSMAYRFHFEGAATNNATAGNNCRGKNAGFHRLLLHAVCQFHGMNASSSTCSYPNNCNLGDGQQNATATERVLTVTGTCCGREYRIVHEACRYMEEES